MIKWFNNKKFRTKLIIGLGAIISLMLVAISIGYYGLTKNAEQFKSLHNVSNEAQIANEIQEYLLKSRVNYEKFLFDSSSEEAVAFENNVSHMKKTITSFKETSDNEERIVYIADIERSVIAYETAFQRLVVMNDQQLEKHHNLVEVGNRLLTTLRGIEEDSFESGNQVIGQTSAKAVEYLLNMRFVAFRYYVFHYDSDFEDYKALVPRYLSHVNNLMSLEGEHAKGNQTILEDTDLYRQDMEDLHTIFKEKDVLISDMNQLSPEITHRVQSIINSVNEEVETANNSIEATNYAFVRTMIVFSLLAIVLSMLMSGYLIRIIVMPIQLLMRTFEDISKGSVDLSFRMDDSSKDEFGLLSKAFNNFMVKLKEMMESIHQQNWINKAHGDINAIARDKNDTEEMSQLIIAFLCDYLKVPVGTMFIKKADELILGAGHGYIETESHKKSYKLGQGIIGQVAQTGKVQVLSHLPSDYMTVQTSLGKMTPKGIIIVPCVYEDEVLAVIEVGTDEAVTDELVNFFESIAHVIGAEIHSADVNRKVKALLEETLIQAEELQVQREELEQTNEELAAHTLELERQQSLIEEKADDLETANQYKTEFLANMSHELRTPLNSILVLSQLLATRDSDCLLTEKEQSFAKTIHTSGKDLLNIINDILDLSKVEAGHLDIIEEDVVLKDVLEHNENLFRPLTESKGIELKASISEKCPQRIQTDGVRLNQIIKNLMSNAIKFTNEGAVSLLFDMTPENELSICVADTGIGISKEKQEQVFEAFKQSDGTTSRQYGGTGLGLSISKELTEKLGGSLSLESQLGVGSRFKILLPVKVGQIKGAPLSQVSGHKTLLIVEDDANFASILQSLSEEQGYETIVVDSGESAIAMAKAHKPMGIVLDLGLPDICGVEVVEALKKDALTREIPIHVISGREEETVKLPENVIGFLKKPVDIKSIYSTLSKIESASSKELNHLLVVGACGGETFDHFTSLANVMIDQEDNGDRGLELSNHKTYQCAIVDMNLPDMTGIDFITAVNKNRDEKMPIIVYTDRDFSEDELRQVKLHTDEIILKSEKSKERLVGEVQQFLKGFGSLDQMNATSKKEQQQKKMFDLNESNGNILLVDDDERNTFALSHLLENQGLTVTVLHNGDDCIQHLSQDNNIDLVLMDIMMPVKDGYETISHLRNESYGKDIPIIALTAKAMKEDKEKCLAVGANDYLTKPVDTSLLMAKIKDWLNDGQ